MRTRRVHRARSASRGRSDERPSIAVDGAAESLGVGAGRRRRWRGRRPRPRRRTSTRRPRAGRGRNGGTPFKPKFFTAHECATVGVLVDLIIPKDERSGSATDAGVPEFMDFMMIDQPRRQIAMRGGLALARSAVRAIASTSGSSTAPTRSGAPLLDDIAYTAERRRRPAATASRSSTASATSPRPASGRRRWASRICSIRATCSSASGTAARTPR